MQCPTTVHRSTPDLVYGQSYIFISIDFWCTANVQLGMLNICEQYTSIGRTQTSRTYQFKILVGFQMLILQKFMIPVYGSHLVYCHQLKIMTKKCSNFTDFGVRQNCDWQYTRGNWPPNRLAAKCRTLHFSRCVNLILHQNGFVSLWDPKYCFVAKMHNCN